LDFSDDEESSRESSNDGSVMDITKMSSFMPMEKQESAVEPIGLEDSPFGFGDNNFNDYNMFSSGGMAGGNPLYQSDSEDV